MKIFSQSVVDRTHELVMGIFQRSDKRMSNSVQESTRICPGCKVERDFVDEVNSLKTTCKSCRGTWDAFDSMFENARWEQIEKLNPVK